MSVVLYATGIIIFLTLMIVSIGLHEAGHMVAARKLGVNVPRFFIGFGKTLWSREYKGTEYGVKAIPLGGFVEIVDENVTKGHKERELLSFIPPWRRYLIYAAGPFMNILLGVIVLLGVFLVTPAYYPNTTVESVTSGGALSAGMSAGDRIVSINGEPIHEFSDIGEHLTGSNHIIVDRGGELVELNIAGDEQGKIGILLSNTRVDRDVPMAVQDIFSMLSLNVQAIASIPEYVPNLAKSIVGVEERDTETIGSVITVGNLYGRITSGESSVGGKALELLGYAGMFNLGLGLINLAPILPLDGGRMLITFFDQVKWWWAKARGRLYRPFNLDLVESFMITTGLVVFGFMGLLLLSDIFNPIRL